tara:strand:+ start:598 stop:936 length:339 start_codon:yes stop_codon:yes gene_type:complete
MKKLPSYYPANDEMVKAYQLDDIERLRVTFEKAENLWRQEFSEKGSNDWGSCTGGKGLQVWFVKKRGRSAERITVVHAPCQGNMGASESKQTAMDFLTHAGIEHYYYDGWMD